MRIIVSILGALALPLGFSAFRCKLGVHGPKKDAFVGDSWTAVSIDDVAQAIYAATYPDAAGTWGDPESVWERNLARRQAYAALQALGQRP